MPGIKEQQRPGLLFVVAAPSGAGKTTLCKALMETLKQKRDRPLHWSCSYTTRKPRKGERHGRDYFFVDDETFSRMIEKGEFAEWAEVHGRRYGTSKKFLEEARNEGRDLLVEIDIQGAKQLKRHYKDAVYIFILPPSWSALERRLKKRGTEPEEEIQRRLKHARKEMLEWRRFDYIIINDDFQQAVDRLRCIVAAVRLQRKWMEQTVRVLVRESLAKR